LDRAVDLPQIIYARIDGELRSGLKKPANSKNENDGHNRKAEA
jgi:hypothetical protein